MYDVCMYVCMYDVCMNVCMYVYTQIMEIKLLFLLLLLALTLHNIECRFTI